ncbi:uncharacterized protein rush isoform X1 [Drosophila pseudoobscura]|uniref:Uncharacterized protein rush isoform X1 n=1 Tax=Drosophila pseudoobscura pseudoobscura TaxID=46245 RepID=A0A6I8UZI6_DROPS|nr:uncharacterized protein LOC6902081 isoform X1 [Drosophila pseudoobscura]
MDNPNIIVTNAQFDWDAINVGDYNLDHSQNFFAAANKENNPLNNGNLLLGTTTTPQAKMAIKVEQPSALCWNSDSNYVKLPTGPKEEQQVDANPPTSAQEPKKKQQVNANPSTCPKQEPAEELVSDGEPITIPKPNTELSPDAPVKNEDEVEYPNEPEMGLKLRSQWSPRPHTHHQDAGPAPPKAYEFMNIYQHNRELAARRRTEDERKARQFHSRPMPNFPALHKRLDEIVVCHKITIPKTPETVKHWQIDLDRRKSKEQQQPQLNKVRRPLHLHDDQPCHPRPFQLRSDQRVRERREYDAAVQVSLEKKKKEVNQDEQRKRCEEEQIKEIRKMTVFKARPNPFK